MTWPPHSTSRTTTAATSTLSTTACETSSTSTTDGHRARRASPEAWTTLDLIAKCSRAASLFGRRLLCLVQSNDPNVRFEPVGAMTPHWNDAEWLRSAR